jgi:murein L,D-transpeptidase YcbB/YkuD
MKTWLWVAVICLVFGQAAVAADAELLWFAQGRPTPQALEAMNILASAEDEGLSPGDYAVDRLRSELERLLWGGGTPAEIARWDAALTEAMTRFLQHVHSGRVDPFSVQVRFSGLAHQAFAPKDRLIAAVRRGRLAQLVDELAPKIPLYAQIRDALGPFRRMAADPRVAALWDEPLPSLPGGKVAPGQSYLGLPLVVRRLKALGDLPPETPESSVMTPDIVQGIRAFQQRHGLLVDGVLGRRTAARLNVSPAAGVRQMELTMERLRWARLLGRRVVAVYLPENVLEAYEVDGAGNTSVRLRMRVITGSALKTPTPIFDDAIRAIELSPYWNVPFSIAREELIPKFLRDPEVFYREGFEFVLGDGSVDTGLSAERLDAVAQGRIRLRQRPGPYNPMGDIKFILSNKDGIFLHHTATPQLFERARRDLSHGCIRVEDPVRLAQFVLEDDPSWDTERLRAAMGQSAPTVLRVRRPAQVLLLYCTVRVQAGRPAFLADIYGLDRVLDQALRYAAAHP